MEELLSRFNIPEGFRLLVGSLAIVALTIIAGWAIKAILFGVARSLTKRTSTDLDDRLLSASRRSIYYLVYILGLSALLNFVEGGVAEAFEKVFVWLDGVLWVILVFLIAHVFVKIAAAAMDWYGANIASKTETTVDDEFIPLLDRAIKVIVYILALLIILDHFEVDIKGLIAVLGVGSLAIALAAQETIANMIGGFVIMIDRPFRRGDRIRLDDGTVCVVHTIGIRSTKFWTFDNTLIIVPNAELMKSTVHNITYPFPRVRVRVDVGVSYDTDMEHVQSVMLDEAHSHSRVLEDPAPSFFFLEFGDSSLNVSLRCHVDDVGQQFRTGSELRFQILERFRREGIEIPFPQRVVTMVGGTTLPAEEQSVPRKAKRPPSLPEKETKPAVKPKDVPPRPVRGGSVDFDGDGDE